MKQFALGLSKAILKPPTPGDVAHDLGSANDDRRAIERFSWRS
jgi:hypothetical protein